MDHLWAGASVVVDGFMTELIFIVFTPTPDVAFSIQSKNMRFSSSNLNNRNTLLIKINNPNINRFRMLFNVMCALNVVIDIFFLDLTAESWSFHTPTEQSAVSCQ